MRDVSDEKQNESSKNILKGKKEQIHRSIFFKRRVNFFWSGLKKKRDRKSRCFFRLTHKKSLCVCLFAQEEQERERKRERERERKKEEKNNCLSSFHTRRTAAQQITTTTYHSPRERERETERQRDFVVVVAKKKKKTTTGFERERSDARETKRTVSVWGNSI